MKQRSEVGVYLIELMVALVISGMLAVVLGDNIAKTIQINTRTEKSVEAPLMAQEIMERLRSCPFDQWPPTNQQFQINIDPANGVGITSPPVASRALMLDGVDLRWLTGSSTVAIPNYKFAGNAVISYANSVQTADSRNVQVAINWSDSSSVAAHSYVLNSLVYRYGIQQR